LVQLLITARQKAVASMAGAAMLQSMGGEFGRFDQVEAASLIGWWLEAGVDVAVADEPRNWLRRDASQPVASQSAPEQAPSQAAADTLDAYHAWLASSSDLPLFRSGSARALPHGPANAEIMLISDLPGRECAAEGKPIGGEAWTLTQRMLKAIGLSDGQAYVATLSCFGAPGQRIDAAALERCSTLMRKHIALVKPKRLLLLGDGPARALLGQPLVQARGRVHKVDGIAAVATLHPRQLLQRPSDKAHSWRDLLILMSE
jgi:DNA polymerase